MVYLSRNSSPWTFHKFQSESRRSWSKVMAERVSRERRKHFILHSWARQQLCQKVGQGFGEPAGSSSRNLCPVHWREICLHGLILQMVGKVPAFWFGPSTPTDRGDGQLWVQIPVVLKKSYSQKFSPSLTELFMHPFNKLFNTCSTRHWTSSNKYTLPKESFA